jgi:hypothetical protein
MSRYQVLLSRPSGVNKTIFIDDCLSEQEAKDTAQSMYGMEALIARQCADPQKPRYEDKEPSYVSEYKEDGGGSDGPVPELRDIAAFIAGSVAVIIMFLGLLSLPFGIILIIFGGWMIRLILKWVAGDYDKD